MTQKIKKIMLIVLLLIEAMALANREILYRSQSQDTARQLVGITQDINLFNVADYYGMFSLTPEYTRSYNARNLAKSFFGCAITDNDHCHDARIIVSGSRNLNRARSDLLADYFGLPADFLSSVVISPQVENFLIDGATYIGLDPWLCGLWFRIHAPLVYTRWNFGLDETVIKAGQQGYDAGYFSPEAVAVDDLNKSFSSFLAGSTPLLNNNVIFKPLVKDRVVHGWHSSFGLSDIQMAMGLNFWQDIDYHLGGGLSVSAPTGTRIGQSSLLLQPVIGNGHHWQAGAFLTSHFTFWRNCDQTKNMGIYFDADLSYLFATRQCRTFDLLGAGQMSRYMLLEQMTPTITNNLVGNPLQEPIAPIGSLIPIAQFVNVFTPAVNVTNASVRVAIPFQADMSLLLHYNDDCFDFDCGYNFWATFGEQITSGNNSSIIQSNTYALKGDSQVFGFSQSQLSPSLFFPVALSATQTGSLCGQGATLYSGLNLTDERTVAQAITNPGIDNSNFAYADITNVMGADKPPLYSTPNQADAVASNQILTSVQPLFISDENLDFQGAKRAGLSNKFFAHFSWRLDQRGCFSPFVGFGGMIECAANTTKTDPTVCRCLRATCSSNSNCDGSRICAVGQWGIWFKGGASF